MSLESSRTSYGESDLDVTHVARDPIAQLQAWVEEAYAHKDIVEANAMCVATVSANGQPSSRMVLMRGLDARGLTFYTSYDSRKGQELSQNPRVAATMYWAPLHRQVRIEGVATKLGEDESDRYFSSRPRGHQLGAWASEQSEPVAKRNDLLERLEHFEQRFEGEDVPRPHSWGGYVIAPQRFEFWQGRDNRLHDRIEYEREARGWTIRRLQP
jgi:pyridoxamine 5'-phosphate oxidase